MSLTMDDLIELARKLTPADRARLVGGILETLDEPDPAIDATWRDEAERRAAGMDSGERRSKPAA